MLAGKIYTIRGQKVMLDRDLAQIYGYETKNFNLQVKRNIGRFAGSAFMFQLTREEFQQCLISQIATSNGGRGGTRKLPYAFTEQGIYMLMTVLKGELAISQSRALIMLFKQMKDVLASNQSVQLNMSGYLYEVSSRVQKLEEQTVKKSELQDFIAHFTDQNLGKQMLVLQGQIVEAYSAYQQIFAAAKHSIGLIDNYLSMKTLLLFKNIPASISVTIFTDKVNNGLHQKELQEFAREYPQRKIIFKKTKLKFHDRFIIIDFKEKSQEIYLCGSSLKDSGRRVTTIVKLQDEEIFSELFSKLE